MRLLLVGDSHANARWWADTVVSTAQRSGAERIIQLGDFGYWPRHSTGRSFLATVASGVERAGIPVDFIDGNHEDHGVLQRRATAPYEVAPGVRHLPRGHRLEHGGVHFLALGGAHSVDRNVRTVGVDWFPDETLDLGDLERAETGAAVDVLLAHDTFSGYDLPTTLPAEKIPSWLTREFAASRAHRELVRSVVDAVHPQLVVHGHYHSRYSRQLRLDGHAVRVEGLDRDGSTGAFLAIDVADGGYEVRTWH